MITGKNELDKKFERMALINIRKGVGRGIILVQGEAKSNCGGFSQESGELQKSIYIKVQSKDDTVTGICYTNKEYAPYVEFGTGPVGQANHEGISPEVTIAYGQSGWMIPGDAMEKEKAERYGLGVIENKDGNPIGYLTNGQAAKPYLYPALKDNEDEIIKTIGKEIKKQL